MKDPDLAENWVPVDGPGQRLRHPSVEDADVEQLRLRPCGKAAEGHRKKNHPQFACRVLELAREEDGAVTGIEDELPQGIIRHPTNLVSGLTPKLVPTRLKLLLHRSRFKKKILGLPLLVGQLIPNFGHL